MIVVPSGLVRSAVVHGPVALALGLKIEDVSPLVSTAQLVQPMSFASRKFHQSCNAAALKVPLPFAEHPPYSVTKMARPAFSAVFIPGSKPARGWLFA